MRAMRVMMSFGVAFSITSKDSSRRMRRSLGAGAVTIRGMFSGGKGFSFAIHLYTEPRRHARGYSLKVLARLHPIHRKVFRIVAVFPETIHVAVA